MRLSNATAMMLFANSLTDPPSVSLKLNVAGSCGIYLQMLNEVGQGQKRYISTCYLVSFHNRPGFSGTAVEESMFQALDVATCVQNDSADSLVMEISCFGEHNVLEQIPHIREFANLARGTRIKIYADVYPRCMPPRVLKESDEVL